MLSNKGINIHKMIEKDLDETFFKIGLMYKKNPNYKTMHNFGTLISKYGHEISFCSKKNIKYATELLLAAEKQNQSFITLKELGDIYANQKEYETAISYYTVALNKKVSYGLCYNLAFCYYRLYDYVNMKRILKYAIENLKLSDYELISLQEMLGLASAEFGDKQNALRMYEALKNNPVYEKSPETIKLAYLCDDYSFILQNYKSIFADWILQAVDYKILYQVSIRSDSEQFKDFENWIEEEVFNFYRDNPDFEQDIELLESIKNKDCIPKIKLLTDFVFTCDFY